MQSLAIAICHLTRFAGAWGREERRFLRTRTDAHTLYAPGRAPGTHALHKRYGVSDKEIRWETAEKGEKQSPIFTLAVWLLTVQWLKIQPSETEIRSPKLPPQHNVVHCQIFDLQYKKNFKKQKKFVRKCLKRIPSPSHHNNSIPACLIDWSIDWLSNKNYFSSHCINLLNLIWLIRPRWLTLLMRLARCFGSINAASRFFPKKNQWRAWYKRTAPWSRTMDARGGGNIRRICWCCSTRRAVSNLSHCLVQSWLFQ